MQYKKPKLIDLSLANAKGTCNAGSSPGVDCLDGSSATGDCIGNGSSATSQCDAVGSVVSNYCTDGTIPGAFCQAGSNLN